ncbi:DUF2304 domain-containing protein [Paenibacillus sp. YN15]|uniref:DUF2304 domain-containing protein n=1 Tax=Paenibacillus sp. YN15 TaxID=1742774 RepID=UPI000DCCA7B1|nr:DUF2304 domain-containing protein [Paenibacillus sp. YN15]RAV05440.1 DUF2304 domain-containing protein [Paenibacillus sp. YN15]
MSVYQISAAAGFGFLLLTGELIRRRKIEERYALLWLLLGLAIALFSFAPGLLERLSRLLQVHYAPSLLFLLGLLFSLAFIMHLTIVMSRMHRRMVRLAQEVAILKEELEGAATAPILPAKGGAAHG